MPGRVIYLVRSWPRLSQTFILNEILALERRGLDLAVFSLVRSGESVVQPAVAQINATVTVLEDQRRRGLRTRLRAHATTFSAAPIRYIRTLIYGARHPELAAGYGESSTLRSFDDAVTTAAAIARMSATEGSPVHVHAHFAHDPALVGLLVSRLTELPFSFTGHARDLFQILPAGLEARARAATAIVTCCQANAEYIDATVPRGGRPPVTVIHHGVALDRFQPPIPTAAETGPRLVSVGRLVEKKGHLDLLRALADVVAAGGRFSCRIYGDGPLFNAALALRDALGLGGHVLLMGACDSDEVVAALADSDMFVLTPRVTEDGDRDGIPNALVEAMACGLPVVTTTAGGITELVRGDVNGLVVDPGDVTAIAASIWRLMTDETLRRRLGAAARQTVEAEHDVEKAAASLERIFRPLRSTDLGVAR